MYKTRSIQCLMFAWMSIAIITTPLTAETVIKGTVVSVGPKVKIKYEGQYAPSTGDPVEIGFELEEVFLPLDGDWKIIKADHEFAWADNAGTDGEKPSDGYLAVIKSRNPKKRSELSASKKGVQNGKVMLYDTFDDNQYGWDILKTGDLYHAYFEGGTYIIETKNDNITRLEIKPDFNLPKSFRLEVMTTWNKGIDNKGYGFLVGVDTKNYYLFLASGNGYASVSWRKNSDWMPKPIPWQQVTDKPKDGTNADHLRIDVRGDIITYYVDGQNIGKLQNTMIKTSWILGLCVSGRQKVAFDNLRVTRLNQN